MSRTIETKLTKEDVLIEKGLRPLRLSEYLGQEKIKTSLGISIKAAKLRNEPLDHILLYGPPGLGKTTLAQILANEMGVNIKISSGPAIEKPGDIAAILNGLKAGDILFIDEIHRLNRVVEEVLYSAMEDFCIDIMIGKGPAAKSVRMKLPKFTLIGATTRVGMLTAPLRDRFGEIHKLEYYTIEELSGIVMKSAQRLDTSLDLDSACELARRSRGTPRIANRLLKRVRDYAIVANNGIITKAITDESLDMLDIDKFGLDAIDRKYLETIIERFNGGPVGVETLSASLSEETETIEDVYEPYLLQLGFIQRTPKGRIATDASFAHLGLEKQ
ncbi:MAG: Holliday junction branch migration DNA helicase RuvB [Lachnospiraceae bacterium]|nr:Holliday junction branch migration DNA helicase RuvB [Lachnospiraceae bacterium]